MSNSTPIDQATSPAFNFTLKELGALLCQFHGFHEGRFQVGLNLRLGVGAIQGPPGTQPVPGATVGIEGVSFNRVPDNATGHDIVDAAEVNPRKAAKATAARKIRPAST